MRVIISSGIGPLHFIPAAKYLAKKVESLRLICGYVPRKTNTIFLKILAFLRGKNIRAAVKKRIICCEGFEISSCVAPEVLYQIILITSRFARNIHSFMESAPWRLFGWQSKRYIKDADIFHVRSGAGHGGAIKKARHLGMRIIVDHSIAHPSFMDTNLRLEYEKNNACFEIGMHNDFWRMIDEECKMADIIQVNSDFVKRTFIDAGYNENNIRVVYLGVSPDFWGLRKARFIYDGDKSPLRLLFTGGFSFRKGAEYLLEACKILKDYGVLYEMHIVGDCSSSLNMIKRYENYKLPVIFHGQVPQDELKDYLSSADIYLFPSLAEGCAQSGMEALAAGLCVVGTYESGFPITNDVNGYIVKSKDPYAIADRVKWLNGHRKEIDRNGQNAANMIRENYSWDNYAENTCKIYNELFA